MISSLKHYIDRKLAARTRRAAQRAALEAVQAFPLIQVKAPHGLAAPLIVSLTSYAKRFGTLSYTIKSLLDQDVEIDHVVLWVSPEDRAILPSDVADLQGPGFSVQVTKDIRSYTKLIPALIRYPEAYIITADDDIHYPSDWARTILSGYIPGKAMIVARRTHMAIAGSDGATWPYIRWPHTVADLVDPAPGHALFPTGVGGVLYPPAIFDREILNEALFLDICPYNDDIWFFWMQLISGIERRRVGGVQKFIAWPSTQETGLLNDNLHLGRNDSQVIALEQRFGKLETFIGRAAQAE